MCGLLDCAEASPTQRLDFYASGLIRDTVGRMGVVNLMRFTVLRSAIVNRVTGTQSRIDSVSTGFDICDPRRTTPCTKAEASRSGFGGRD